MDNPAPTNVSPSALVCNVQLPAAALRVIVDPPDLAPWTAAFWQRFPEASKPPSVGLQLQAVDRESAEIVTPKERMQVRKEDAEKLWDWTMRLMLQTQLGSAVLHAGLVGTGSTALLIGGSSGTGKSTLVRGLIGRGWWYGGDEYVRVRAGGVEAIPRCLEWSDSWPEDVQPDPGWSYQFRVGEAWHTSRAGHVLGHARSERVAWKQLQAMVWLRSERDGPGLTRLPRPPAEAWLRSPRWIDFVGAFRSTGIPWFELRPGTRTETVAFLVDQFAAG